MSFRRFFDVVDFLYCLPPHNLLGLALNFRSFRCRSDPRHQDQIYSADPCEVISSLRAPSFFRGRPFLCESVEVGHGPELSFRTRKGAHAFFFFHRLTHLLAPKEAATPLPTTQDFLLNRSLVHFRNRGEERTWTIAFLAPLSR